MAILSKPGQIGTITAGRRALGLFTNRSDSILRFLSYLNNDPTPQRILFYCGDGGNGKSLLLRFLREYGCKRLNLDDWVRIQRLRGDDLLMALRDAPTTTPIPYAYLDFGMPPQGDNRPQEAFAALLMLRRACLEFKFRSPLFDFACLWYLLRTHRETKQRLPDLFPSEEIDFITNVADAISGLPLGSVAKAALNLVGKHFGKDLATYLARRSLNEEQVLAIQRMDPETELVDELPAFFAQDLNAFMARKGSPPRIVFFFDTHEAFWGCQRDVSDSLYFERDKWLRRLLDSLERGAGIVAVVAGRPPLRWSQATEVPISEDALDLQLVEHLSDDDALHYLERAGITNSELRQQLVDYASVRSNQVHPYFLGLSADVVLATQQLNHVPVQGFLGNERAAADNGRKLTERLLRYVDRDTEWAVRALSACRSFDQDIWRYLGGALHFEASDARFDLLTQFSFVWQAGDGTQARYRIHDLLRRLLRERDDNVVRRADEALKSYYQRRFDAGERLATAELVYHVNCLDPEAGVTEWVEAFTNAVDDGRYDVGRALLEVRGELCPGTDYLAAEVAFAEGYYYSSLSRDELALQAYREAIARYDVALTADPDDADSWASKALTLSRLADLRAEQRSDHAAANADYLAAVTASDEALQRDPTNADAHDVKVMALGGLGNVALYLGRHGEAGVYFRQALTASNEALASLADLTDAQINRSYILGSLGDLQKELAQYNDAFVSYKEAAIAAAQPLENEATNVMALHNQAYALLSLGELESELAQYDMAEEDFFKAVALFEQVLAQSSLDTTVLVNLIRTYESLGELEAERSRYQVADDYYQRALQTIAEMRQLAPDATFLHLNWALALVRRGDLQAEIGAYEAAAQSYLKAITVTRNLPQQVANEEAAYLYQGEGLCGLADLQLTQSQAAIAVTTYQEASAVLAKAMQLVPKDLLALHKQARVAVGLADAFRTLGQFGEAEQQSREAAALCDRILNRAADDVVAWVRKGKALQALGRTLADQEQADAAAEQLRHAIAAFDKALERAPDDVTARQSKGETLLRLADEQEKLGQHQPALANRLNAQAELVHALSVAPQKAEARRLYNETLQYSERSEESPGRV